jgi:dienelactone hydrolase
MVGVKQRNLSPWAYWMLRLEALERDDPCPVDEPAAIPAWRARARDRLDALVGHDLERVPLDLEERGVADAGSYRRTSVVFDSEPAMSVPAYLLVPHERTQPGPAVLAVHGHGGGKDDVCGVTAGDGGDFAHQLAQLGYVVLAPDLRCFGERADWTPPDKYACDLNLVHAYAAGENPLAQNLWDLARCIDVLEQHELVDPAAIGVAGFSYGATLTLFLAARDERVRAAVVSGYVSTWEQAHRMPWNLCGSQVLPGMLGRIDHAAVGALVTPRALLVETGDHDPIFPLAGAREVYEQLVAVAASCSAAEAVQHHVFAGGHRWDGAATPGFLARHLGPTA